MYLEIASTPAVFAAPPKPANGSTPSATSAGLGQYRGALRIPVPRFIPVPRGRGMGNIAWGTRSRGVGAAQTNPCACYWPQPGVAPTPGLPACNSQGCAPNCSAQQCATPFCSGIPYGQPGYTECLAATAQAYSVEEPQAASSITQFIATLPASVAKPATPAAAPPAATPAAAIVAATPSLPPATSGGPASPSPAACAANGGTMNSSGQCIISAPAVSNGPATGVVAGGSVPSSSDWTSAFSWLENSVSVFGYSFPVWALGLAAVAGVWAVSSMGKGK
jgi:hypothetical protein